MRRSGSESVSIQQLNAAGGSNLCMSLDEYLEMQASWPPLSVSIAAYGHFGTPAATPCSTLTSGWCNGYDRW